MKDLFTFKKLLLCLFTGYVIHKTVAQFAPSEPVLFVFDVVIVNAVAWVFFFIFSVIYFVYIDKRKQLIADLRDAGKFQNAALQEANAENEKLSNDLTKSLSEKQEYQSQVHELKEEVEVIRADYQITLDAFSKVEKEEAKLIKVNAALKNGNELLKEENEALKKALETYKKKGKNEKGEKPISNTLPL